MSITLLILVGLNALATWYTLQNRAVFERFTFQVGPTLGGQWDRLLTAGFLHVHWPHFAFNMITLYFFGPSVERWLGSGLFLLVYFGSLLGGNLLALLYHRSNPEYRAVGASGAVSGVVYAAIAGFPGMELAFIFIPVPFPAWIYGVGFILYSIYGMGRQHDNIGHEAHLGGALAGLLLALALDPSLIEQNTLTILYILVPAVVLLIVLFVRPKLLGLSQSSSNPHRDIDLEYRESKLAQARELNRILEKIQREGRESLSAEEKRFLEQQR